MLLAVSLPDERLRQEPRAFVAERLRPHRQVDGRAAVEFDGSGAPWETGIKPRVADVAPRLAFEPPFLLESLLAIGFGQYPRADGDGEHDDDGGAAVALKFRHIHPPRDAYAANPI